MSIIRARNLVPKFIRGFAIRSSLCMSSHTPLVCNRSVLSCGLGFLTHLRGYCAVSRLLLKIAVSGSKNIQNQIVIVL
jgi:hypothetical protein